MCVKSKYRILNFCLIKNKFSENSNMDHEMEVLFKQDQDK